MEQLESNLDFVRIPESNDRIHKQECCISFDTPKSEGGLFVDMKSFLAFGKDYVGWNYEKTGNPVYLHIEKTRKPVSKGVEGGFDNTDPEYQENYEIVILPCHVTIPLPSKELPPKVKLAVDYIINWGSEEKEQDDTWNADQKPVSKHAMDLKQLDNGVIIAPSGWKCERCGNSSNLWVNLTDGSILCDGSNRDGTGGDDCAFDHYEMTKYPLAVKLGTITADLEAADVYSYDEEEIVLDPLLAQHLQHFGFDFSSLKRTEPTTSEKELAQNTDFGWNHIQETGGEVEPLFGPGYTGLVNLGNSCYLAAVMQVLFATRSFRLRYHTLQSLQDAFATAAADPTMDLNVQLTKLAHGLLSGKYSNSAIKKQDGISPFMFKSLITGSDPELSTTGQQDALAFFLYFMDQVEKFNRDFDPSRTFKFGIEERFQCSSGKVSYVKSNDFVLSLDIPLHKAINKKDLEDFQKLIAEKCTLEEQSSDKIVSPRVSLMDCLDYFSAPEELHDFYSTFLNAKTTATKTAGLTSFPDYLVIHMQKFFQEEAWDPEKLDVYIDVPEVIDISRLRSKGLQPGEELLPEPAAVEDESKVIEDIVSQLASMGFTDLQSRKAAIIASNAGAEAAANWLLNNPIDLDVDDPVMKKQVMSNVDVDATPSSSRTSEDDSLPDGIGRYRLFGIVSHIGSTMHTGHYVAHICKEGRWVTFNDEQVGVSKNPPMDTGYLYFFERADS